MEMTLHTEGTQEAEQLIAVLCIGICVALKSGTMSINEVENCLFSPYTISVLEQTGLSERAVELIHMGTELEDVESLAPDKLPGAIDELKDKAIALLGSMPPRPLPRERWVKGASNE
jgi:hypothetical protein